MSRVQGITVRRNPFEGEFQANWDNQPEDRRIGNWLPDTHVTRESTARKFNIALNYKEMQSAEKCFPHDYTYTTIEGTDGNRPKPVYNPTHIL